MISKLNTLSNIMFEMDQQIKLLENVYTTVLPVVVMVYLMEHMKHVITMIQVNMVLEIQDVVKHVNQ